MVTLSLYFLILKIHNMKDLKHFCQTIFLNRFTSNFFISSKPLQILGLLSFLCFSAVVFSQTPNVVIKKYNQTQAFTSITVDNAGNIWAGTNKAGLFKLNKSNISTDTAFGLVPTSGNFDVKNFNIQAVATDKIGNVWVGHNGAGGSAAAGGGLERYAISDPSVTKHFVPIRDVCNLAYDERDGISSLNVRSVAVDKNNRVWTAHSYHDLTVAGTGYYVSPGGMSYSTSLDKFKAIGTRQNMNDGLLFPANTCNPAANLTAQTRTCPAIAVGNNEVLLSVFPYTSELGYNYPARVARFDLNGKFIQDFSFEDMKIPPGGVINGIFITPKGDAWMTVSVAGKGFAVRKKDDMYYINPQTLPCIFPNGIIFNPNAVWGNPSGQVFLGTNKGLVVYNGSGSLQSVTSYTLYTVATDGLMSDNIMGGVSETDSTQWVITDKGVMRLKIGRTFKDIDYTFCNNNWINEIEKQSLATSSLQIDYHSYEVSTEICDKNGPKGENCTAEFVYKLMKEDVSLNAPTPAMFPYDKMSTALLFSVSKKDLLEIQKNVNAWKESLSDGNEFGGIKYIRQVMPPNLLSYYLDLEIYKGVAFIGDAIFGETRDELTKLQQSFNPKAIVSCAPYRLYNSPNFITDRALYRVPDFIYCGFNIGLESIQYDPVWIFADDKNLTFTNYTQPGHLLNPGKVFRSVIEECGKVKIVTLGTGTNYCAAKWQGKMNGNGNVIAGSILFKNIDIKLKKTFESR